MRRGRESESKVRRVGDGEREEKKKNGAGVRFCQTAVPLLVRG